MEKNKGGKRQQEFDSRQPSGGATVNPGSTPSAAAKPPTDLAAKSVDGAARLSTIEHMATILLRARVERRRAKAAEKILARLGLKPSDAVNMLYAQIEENQGLPFPVRLPSEQVPVKAETVKFWNTLYDDHYAR